MSKSTTKTCHVCGKSLSVKGEAKAEFVRGKNGGGWYTAYSHLECSKNNKHK